MVARLLRTHKHCFVKKSISLPPYARESKTFLDPGFQLLDFSLWMSVERGFWIAIVSGIPDSLSCITDPQA